ncbi:GTP-binding protein [Actinomycetospora sp. NBRC 106378]|uniref:CobW family GTP-binding protein n=1 Tax=Actinomycetospora sp. NBRC 106378 TaxID=3032208 RepID=UPI0024A09697|nr:GTP-binding protein [Actinomycetospora sp. NBRC 106378]GLZ54754.1 cobalamin biosynthesis protein CobW [Actinomycetospora sp. NBRC 106378]
MRTVPVVLVAGHLGVGKSSLVNHLLRHADGTRIGVVVNDFGALGIDAMLVAGQASSVTALSNGCLCCVTDADGLSAVLADLVAPATGLDLVVVEASGLAEPRELVRLLLASPDPHAVYGGLVAVLDACAPDLEHARLADLAVVNGLDRCGAAAVEEVRAVAPGAVIGTSHGALDPALLVDPVHRPQPAQLTLDALLREADGEHPHVAASSVSFTSERPLDAARLAAFLESGPPGVVRMKGIVRLPDGGGEGFAETPDVWEVQTVGTAIRVRPAPGRLTTRGARLVLIGTDLDDSTLRGALDACVVGDDEPAPSEHAALALTRYRIDLAPARGAHTSV